MELRLTPEIESALLLQAHRRGMTPEQLALTGLQAMLSSPETSCFPAEIEENLVDFLGNSIGTIHSKQCNAKGSVLSEDTGQTFTRILMEKHRYDTQ